MARGALHCEDRLDARRSHRAIAAAAVHAPPRRRVEGQQQRLDRAVSRRLEGLGGLKAPLSWLIRGPFIRNVLSKIVLRLAVAGPSETNERLSVGSEIASSADQAANRGFSPGEKRTGGACAHCS